MDPSEGIEFFSFLQFLIDVEPVGERTVAWWCNKYGTMRVASFTG
jgi:hypothetical protein